jgi:tetratricopeptide (TPR) repeat protein
MGKHAEAETAFRQALAVQEKLAAEFPSVPQYRQELGRSHHCMGGLLLELRKFLQAETVFRQALAVREQLAAEFASVPQYRQALGDSHNDLGLVLLNLRRFPQAETAFRQALNIREKQAADFPSVPDHAVKLSGSYVNFGHLVRERDEPAAALDWYARAMVRLEAVLKQEPRLADARLFLRNAHWERAKALGQLGRYAEAVADWERARACNDEKQRDRSFRLQIAAALARAGQLGEATAAVEALLKPGPADAGTLYDAARVYSLAAGGSGGDNTQAEKHAARAVALLRRAVQEGYENVAQLKQDTDLDPLRQQEDFQAVLAELEKTGAIPMPK